MRAWGGWRRHQAVEREHQRHGEDAEPFALYLPLRGDRTGGVDESTMRVLQNDRV